MEKIIIKGESDIPTVKLDRQNNIFEISGRSMPADARKFYDPILKWFDEYSLEPLPMTELVFKMNYYNTASAKQILEIVIRLEDIYKSGHQVRVTWIYAAGETDMRDNGYELSSIVEVPMIIISTDEIDNHKLPKNDIKKNETFVVTISRELGAGGKMVGRKLAEILQINYYDYTDIEALSNKYDSDDDIIKKTEDNSKPWLEGIKKIFNINSNNNPILEKQSKILDSIARNESCIVAGQGAFYAFRDYPNHINIFICASIENRITRLMTREKISRTTAMEAISQASLERDMYVAENTGSPRHDTRNYDLVLNMDNFSIEDAVEVIMTYINLRKKYFSIIADKD
ncbi:MAG: SiaC family regulatory phosphoprotein [Bacteroidales bacterium]|nr:SiaC family regulatory phosphoprotein [Bacteroidales bacterium]